MSPAFNIPLIELFCSQSLSEFVYPLIAVNVFAMKVPITPYCSTS